VRSLFLDFDAGLVRRIRHGRLAACEHAFVGNAGSPNALFRRALATNNVTLANTAAIEAGQLNLADALSLTLLYRDQAPDRFERAAVRWHSRFSREVRNIASEDAHLALAALLALKGPRPDTGARAFLSLFDALVLIEPAAVIEDWLRRRPAS
jgi:hypothetical protein